MSNVTRAFTGRKRGERDPRLPRGQYDIDVGGRVRNLPRVETCDECGFRYDLDNASAAGSVVMDGVAELAALITDDDSDVRRRVLAGRRSDRPECALMGRDERVEHDGYAEQDPGDVARQLKDGGLLFDNVLSRLGPDDWERVVVYPYPHPTDRSLRWVAMHTAHEVQHHLLDVRRQLP